MREIVEDALPKLYGDERANSEAVQERKERELRIINEMGFDVYFLIVADMCDYARSRNIWWNVRGSGAGSLVAYCTGITGLDPLKNNLIFERFLNPGRVSMPDFDLDYPDDQREEMIRYTIDKYGDERVAQIATFGRMKAKAAIRDIGRAKDISLPEVDRIAKMIPGIPGKPVKIMDVMTEGHEFYNQELVDLYKTQEWVKDLLDTSMQVEGVARHCGIHAAAVIVTDRELTHYTPLMRPSRGSVTKTITQYEFPILESIGLLKVDFLGLSTLSVMREAGRLIEERHGITYNLSNIPFEHKPAEEAFTLLSSGDVSGVFQVESAGMRRVLTEMRPSMFEHIIATISLYRPGPLEYIPNFIRRMHGEEEVAYHHPLLEPILGETYGICVYQEQIIQILSQLAGYTPGDADLVRRAVSKKKAKEIEKHKGIFIEGCGKNGVPASAAKAIYADIEFFARYGFNKCLPGDVEVLDAQTGRLIKIEDLYADQSLLTETVTCDIDTLKLQSGAVSAVMDNGVKPVYRLTTALGRTIEATANHPFYTFSGWRLLEELAVGDQIATPRMVPVEGQNEWPEHELIALGHLLAEGNLCHPASVYYYSQDPEQRDDYVRAAETFENVECSVAIHKETFSVYAKRIDRKVPPGIVSWAKEIDIWGKNALEKEIPSGVFTLRNTQIGLLISRMWEGDGHINSSDRSLFYATSSERLARQLQHLLLRLGIISRLRTVEFAYKEGRIGYQLFITGNENIANFRNAIGIHFISDDRKHRLDKLVLENPVHSTVKDVIPVPIKGVVRAAKERSGVTWKQMNADCGVAQREFYPTGASTKSGFTRPIIQRLADYFEDDILSKYAQSDVYWDRITQIEYVGEKQTYDLEVPNTHNFIANDILVHNSHAADYAVITVQTAYLKAHYPVEYMAALLLIERNKTDKVVIFINECRRLGIAVLPPDVNYSRLDFEIQTLPDDAEPQAKDSHLSYTFPVPDGSAIRFGMAAVKNVGEGPVQAILEARDEGGPFSTLEEFCDRVDLRKVNKRSLECLIKVGAFDRFGNRAQLLAVVDQMVSYSTSNHNARQSGQLSMFDMLGGDSAGMMAAVPIKLQDIEEVSGRDKLLWEKELLGVYAMSHPMQQIGADLEKIVTCSCNELDERYDGQNITMAGMISSVRVINTKKGDPMAFVNLEDLKGQCEMVVFPRTYAEVKDKLIEDTVVLVKGKAQTREGQTNLLADSFQTHIEQAVAARDEQASHYEKPLVEMPPTINGVAFDDDMGFLAPPDEMDDDIDDIKPPPLATPSSKPSPNISQMSPLDVHPNDMQPVDNVTPMGMPVMAMSSMSMPDDHFAPPMEENPFRHDVPDWAQDAPTEQPPVQLQPAPVEPMSEPVFLAVTSTEKTLTESPVSYEVNTSESNTSANGPDETSVRERDEAQRKISEDQVVAPPVNSSNAASQMQNGVHANGNGHGPTHSENGHSENGHSENGHSTNGHSTNGHSTNGHRNHVQGSNGFSIDNSTGVYQEPELPVPRRIRKNARLLNVVFRRSGSVDRDKFRLKELYERIYNPKGKDHFSIRLESNGRQYELSFPNDYCTINERLMDELTRHFRVQVDVQDAVSAM
ncbi:MAG: DNA polymerase III subunit alpha [Chloroflexota bacterium]